MNRWWADADQALKILDRVDDSDVVQGVGTAVLGYHGLAMGFLKPLSEQTLVDAQVIRSVLSEVDLEPVAKALGAATRPVMGEASDHYGELLAYNMHEQAIEATSRFVTALTNTGVDWPSAISRAADIHGVPLDRLGMAGEKLRGPKMAPIAQQDWADRALVGYAAHMGNREADASVSKAMRTRTREWSEDEVNRDSDGRFATTAQSRVTNTQESRKNYAAYQQARKERQAKRAARKARTSSNINAVYGGSGVTPSQEGRERKAPAKEQEKPQSAQDRIREKRREKITQKRKDRRAERIKAMLEKPKPTDIPESFGESLMDPFKNENFTGVRTPINQEYFFMVPAHVAEEIVKVGGFNMGKLRELRGSTDGAVLTGREMGLDIGGAQEEERKMKAAGMFVEDPVSNQVIVRVVGNEIAWAEESSPHPDDDSYVDNGSTFALVKNQAGNYDSDGFEIGATDFGWRPHPAMDKKLFRTISVSLSNRDDFKHHATNDFVPEDAYDEENTDDTPPWPHDRSVEFGMSADWNANLHPRDDEGKFRTRSGGLVQVTSDRTARVKAYQEARKVRREKRRKREARRADTRVGIQYGGTEALQTVAADQQAPARERRVDRDRIRESIQDRIRQKRRDRRMQRRRELRANGYKGNEANNISSMKAVLPTDEDVAVMTHIGETGGTPDETEAFTALMQRLSGESVKGSEAVGTMDKRTLSGGEMVAMGSDDSAVPVFKTSDEAFGFGEHFMRVLEDGWYEGTEPLTPRMHNFMLGAIKNKAHIEVKATEHEGGSGWVPKVFYAPREDNTQTVLVGSDKDWARVTEGQVPRFTIDELVPMSEMLASNGFDAKRIEATHDALVQVIRMDFMDNVKH